MTQQRLEMRRNKVILGVDDQVENLLVLQAVVESAGYTFRSAPSGAECIALVKLTTPHLILLDIEMPDMDGFETCRRLRTVWTVRQTPIAFLTGRKSAEDVKHGLAAGGNDFIVKPFDHDRLLARISHWTRRTIAA
jgi:two-component system, OmpR family, response regulator